MATNPDSLVTAEWVAGHLDDPAVVVAEVDEETTLYDKGHIPGAVGFHWQHDFQDGLRRTFLNKDGFEELLDSKGITNDTHVVLYGGNNNWFAAYAYWYFKVYGHQNVSLLDGGRKLWEVQERELTDQLTDVTPTSGYRAEEPDDSIRAKRDQILSDYIGAPQGTALVDVRSPAEFSGDVVTPGHLPQEAAQVPGHIPGATNVPWSTAVNPETGQFLPTEELRKIYSEAGVAEGDDIVSYCRIGERSAHTWFVLRELLGHDRVRNYDGSWTEYGSLIDVPVER